MTNHQGLMDARAREKVGRRGREGARRRFQAGLEGLESRRLLATFHWASNVDGSFSNPANWLDQNNQPGVPGAGDDATVGFSGIKVTVGSSAALNSLQSSGTVEVAGGTLSLANIARNSQIQTLIVDNGANLQTDGGVTAVEGGSISGTLSNAASAATLFNGGTATALAGAAFTGAGTIDVNGGLAMR